MENEETMKEDNKGKYILRETFQKAVKDLNLTFTKLSVKRMTQDYS